MGQAANKRVKLISHGAFINYHSGGKAERWMLSNEYGICQ